MNEIYTAAIIQVGGRYRNSPAGVKQAQKVARFVALRLRRIGWAACEAYQPFAAHYGADTGAE